MKTTQILTARDIESGQTIAIEGEEFHYLSRVKRARRGNQIVVSTQGGRRFSCTLIHLEENRAEAIVDEELEPAVSPWPVHLLVAVPKHHLMDELIRRVSEIGIESLTPISTQRGVQQAGNTRVSRWQKIAAESMRQCSRTVPLRLESHAEFAEALAQKPAQGTGYLFHPTGPGVLASGISSHSSSPIFLAVGPEGGFTESEVECAASLGYQIAGLGRSIMRIETAAVAASVLAVAKLGGYSAP